MKHIIYFLTGFGVLAGITIFIIAIYKLIELLQYKTIFGLPTIAVIFVGLFIGMISYGLGFMIKNTE